MDILETSHIALLLECSEATARRLIDAGEIKSMPRLTDRSPRRVRKEQMQAYADRKGIDLDWTRIEPVTSR
jgi:hypothetical protein